LQISFLAQLDDEFRSKLARLLVEAALKINHAHRETIWLRSASKCDAAIDYATNRTAAAKSRRQ
jgi:hypothetical protein